MLSLISWMGISCRPEEIVPRPYLCCRECGGELFTGEIYYLVSGRPVCRDCLPQYARRYFSGCRRMVRREGGL